MLETAAGAPDAAGEGLGRADGDTGFLCGRAAAGGECGGGRREWRKTGGGCGKDISIVVFVFP